MSNESPELRRAWEISVNAFSRKYLRDIPFDEDDKKALKND